MPQADVYVFASLVSSALILASRPSYTQACSPQGTAHDDKRGQSVYNECRTSSRHIAHLNSVEDFCLWAPSHPELNMLATRDAKHTLTAWCTKSTNGTYLISDETISWAHFLKTPEYVQITGVGNLININASADGMASASGEGDSGPGLVFTNAYGQLEQVYEWTSFVSQEQFCFRACNPSRTASTPCPQIYDAFGCTDSVPRNYDTKVLEDCVGHTIEAPPRLYQEVLVAPSHDSPNPLSDCRIRGTTGSGRVTRVRRAMASMPSSTSPATVTSFSLSQPHNSSTQSTSSMATTSVNITTTITLPPLPIPSSNTTTFMDSTTPSSSPTLACSFNHTHVHSHWYSHSHRHSHHSFCTPSTSVSSSSSSLPSLSSSWQPTSSVGFSFSDSSSISSTPSPTSFTLTFSTFSSSDPSGTSTPFVTPTSTPTSIFTSSFPTSSYGTSSSLADPSQPSLDSSSPTSSTISTTPPPAPPPSMTSSSSSDAPTFTTSRSRSADPTTSPAYPNSPTQLGSQCPPPSGITVNAGSITLPLTCTILMIVISSFVVVLTL